MANRFRNSSSSRDSRTRSGTRGERTAGVRDELRLAQRAQRMHTASSSDRERDPRQKSASQTRNTHSRLRTSKKTSAIARSSGAVQFFIAVIIFLIAAINFFIVFSSYIQNAAQLNSLKAQEAALVQQEEELSNNISRWSDDAFVTAQARKRLGFVYPGEKSVIVKNAPENARPESETDETVTQTSKKLPWYTELLYSIENIDQAENLPGQRK